MSHYTDPAAKDFDPALLRLILCGGEGLPAAYGPLRFMDPHYLDRKEQGATWSGSERVAYFSDADDCAAWGMDAFESTRMEWRLPLDHWRPRLALVAACLLMPRHSYLCAHIEAGTRFIALTRVRFTEHERGMAIGDWTWDVGSGRTENAQIDLPTLPTHLLTHDPAVALLLSLFGVPEIRAKVEAMND